MNYYSLNRFGSYPGHIGPFMTMGNTMQGLVENKLPSDSYVKKEKDKVKTDIPSTLGKGLAIAAALFLTFKGHDKIKNVVDVIKNHKGSFLSTHKNISIKGVGNCTKTVGKSIFNAAKTVLKLIPDTFKAIIGIFKKTS